MTTKSVIKRSLFLLVLFIGAVLFLYTVVTKALQVAFNAAYLNASCASGAITLSILYMLAKFNRHIDEQIGNFLYFKGKAHYKLLLREAITDGLTGLYDHKYFMLKMEEAVECAKRYKRPISLIMIDIDRFKHYNDMFGHPAGDELLIKLAQAFKQVTRKADIVARYGGEEFAIIMPETPEIGAKTAANRVRAYIEAMKFDQERGVTVSIGVSSHDGKKEGLNKEELIKRADEALYLAKANGRNRVEAQQ